MTTININPSKSSNIEFELSVQGMDNTNDISVRFVVLEMFAGCGVSIECKNVGGSKWAATIPPGVQLSESAYDFRIETVVNEYYFEPAEGKLQVMSDPVVHIEEQTSKPTITAVFEETEPVVYQQANVNSMVDLPTLSEEDLAPIPMPPRTKGTLFSRTSDGKPVVKGLDSKEVAAKKLENTLKVQQILHSRG